MPSACYRHDMATLQVKRVPDDLHAAVKARAAAEGVTVSELILRVLRQTVERPSLQSWIDDVEAAHAGLMPRELDVPSVLDQVRDE